MSPHVLTLLPELLAVASLQAGICDIPDWATTSVFLAFIRTSTEVTLVCEEIKFPAETISERGWRAFEVQGPLPFELIGVLADLTSSLAIAGISVFSISTYSTDYILVKEDCLEKAVTSLQKAGHTIQ